MIILETGGKFKLNISDVEIDCAANLMSREHLERGLVHVYYGDGRGKTSIALGTALRACGHGMRVKVVQLLKGISSLGECKAQREITDFEVSQFGNSAYVFNNKPSENDKSQAALGLSEAERAMLSGEYDVIIVDEAIYALEFGMMNLKALLDLIKIKPEDVELILTGGRNPPKELIDAADYVSHIVLEKHPYSRGIKARKGIDF
jgi:cob(I)alamin adenosyltransferase